MEWIENLIKPLFASAILLLPAFFIIIPVAWIRKRNRRSKNPLTTNMRRPPGAGLAMRLQKERDDVDTPLVYMMMITPFLLAYHYLVVGWFGMPDGLALRICLILIWATVLIYYGYDFIKRAKLIRELRLGYECELAVAQELDMLMLQGYHVFHDIPAGKFNVDHIVVGPPGVFAVETKGRSKPKQASDERFDYKLLYDGKKLQFPNWVETQPVQQAIRQTKWVSEWLSSATAIKIVARPVLVLPGWWIERTCKSPKVAVLSGKNMSSFFTNGKATLTAEQIQRIVHQVDQKVRDLEPGAIVRRS